MRVEEKKEPIYDPFRTGKVALDKIPKDKLP